MVLKTDIIKKNYILHTLEGFFKLAPSWKMNLPGALAHRVN